MYYNGLINGFILGAVAFWFLPVLYKLLRAMYLEAKDFNAYLKNTEKH